MGDEPKKRKPYFSFADELKPVQSTDEHPAVVEMRQAMQQVEAEVIEKTEEIPDDAADVAAERIRKKNGPLVRKLRELVRSWRQADEAETEPEPCPSPK